MTPFQQKHWHRTAIKWLGWSVVLDVLVTSLAENEPAKGLKLASILGPTYNLYILCVLWYFVHVNHLPKWSTLLKIEIIGTFPGGQEKNEGVPRYLLSSSPLWGGGEPSAHVGQPAPGLFHLCPGVCSPRTAQGWHHRENHWHAFQGRWALKCGAEVSFRQKIRRANLMMWSGRIWCLGRHLREVSHSLILILVGRKLGWIRTLHPVP